MNEKLYKDLAAGVVSLFLILTVAYLYFADFHVLPEQRYAFYTDDITGYVLAGTADGDKYGTFDYPREPVFILRFDDLHGKYWVDPAITLTQSALSYNYSITLGVIPYGIFNDRGRDYLLSIKDDPRVEIAQHGTYHSAQEYGNLTEEEAFNEMRAGQKMLVTSLGKVPVTFIPPYNVYSEGTVKASERLGYKILSARQDEFKFDGNVFIMGFNARTKEYGLNESREGEYNTVPLNDPQDVFDDCRKSIEVRNVCVIMIHPQEYVTTEGELDSKKYLEFLKLMEKLKTINAKSVTFKDLVK